MSTDDDPRQLIGAQQLVFSSELRRAFDPSALVLTAFTQLLRDIGSRRRQEGVVLDWSTLRGGIEGDSVLGMRGITLRLTILGVRS